MVVAHAHRPNEIRVGLKLGVDDFEHTGLGSAPEYPEDVLASLRERTAQMALGPFWWTPTIEGLWNYEYVRDHHEHLDNAAGTRASSPTPSPTSSSRSRTRASLLLPAHAAAQAHAPSEVRAAARLGVVLLIGTDSGIPMKFHSQSTWNELDIWVRELGVPAMDAIRAARTGPRSR
jgi:imidazolonepropionase-like amidohydrolase